MHQASGNSIRVLSQVHGVSPIWPLPTLLALCPLTGPVTLPHPHTNPWGAGSCCQTQPSTLMLRCCWEILSGLMNENSPPTPWEVGTCPLFLWSHQRMELGLLLGSQRSLLISAAFTTLHQWVFPSLLSKPEGRRHLWFISLLSASAQGLTRAGDLMCWLFVDRIKLPKKAQKLSISYFLCVCSILLMGSHLVHTSHHTEPDPARAHRPAAQGQESCRRTAQWHSVYWVTGHPGLMLSVEAYRTILLPFSRLSASEWKLNGTWEWKHASKQKEAEETSMGKGRCRNPSL